MMAASVGYMDGYNIQMITLTFLQHPDMIPPGTQVLLGCPCAYRFGHPFGHPFGYPFGHPFGYLLGYPIGHLIGYLIRYLI